MVWLTLVGLGSYLAVTGAVRVALGRKWRGVRFVTMDPRDWTPTEWAAGLLGAGTVATLLAGLVAAAAGHPGPHLDLGWVVGLGGLAAMVGGVALMACAQLTMGPSWRVGVDRAVATDLVVTGPFRVVRNPIYTSMLIAAGGAVLLTPTAAVAAGWILGLLFIEWQVRVVEEPFLLQRHGGRYATWSMNAGRFVPGVGACRPPRASVTVAAPEPTS
jgi:protein-S-isoprenylcysteine O-methyltransferase Ste14